MKILILFLFPFVAFAEMEIQRQQMIEVIKDYGVKNKSLIKVMNKIPRHLFVPSHLKSKSYSNRPLPIGLGQTISQPFIVAYMTNQLKVNKNHRVLEIGTGSGYQAAVLGELVKEVFTIEIVTGLCIRSRKLLKKLNYKNIKVYCGDGYNGWPKYAPFDRIILTAAPPHIPQLLIDQLALNGLLIAPVGVGHQQIIKITKDAKGKTNRSKLLPVRFVPMTGKAQD
ncbi:MAG: protein-L-isoaspartate(D-aspartate) O-methyltransferase [Epsilonproteobacteria bacterium]|nr:MAG: protein-L-isoaspartate(D-aspartate) O-methyltransferase [Campylobacterota bacterium]RLA68091.1 MAG: protein-L-isoaspartate(D-aspartate) O-methyltransferase [Campylobacterota bacterium]